MELVKFNDNFDDLLEKGNIFKKEHLEDNNRTSIPDITFFFKDIIIIIQNLMKGF